jgi:hypothetical protein
VSPGETSAALPGNTSGDQNVPTEVPLSDEETTAHLRVMVQTLPVRGIILTYAQVVERCHPRVSHDAIKRILPKVVGGTSWRCTIGEATVTLEFKPPQPKSPPRGGGWSPSRDGFGGF